MILSREILERALKICDMPPYENTDDIIRGITQSHLELLEWVEELTEEARNIGVTVDEN